jgi:hypothetical protein
MRPLEFIALAVLGSYINHIAWHPKIVKDEIFTTVPQITSHECPYVSTVPNTPTYTYIVPYITTSTATTSYTTTAVPVGQVGSCTNATLTPIP